jgi:hypothetical protein
MPHHEPNSPPDTCQVAFKEWEGVCVALERGLQSIILRKGGISEGQGEFTPEHPVFWLYPTRVHQAEQGLRVAGLKAGDVPAGEVELRLLAVVEHVALVDRPELLEELEDLHVWTKETVEKRFHYRRPGLWVLGVRVYRCDSPWRIHMTDEHAGCKSWVPLDALSTRGLQPVLSRDAMEDHMAHLNRVLAGRRQPEARA